MAQIIDPNEMFFTPFEPKQANRFILYLEGVPAYLIRKASRQSIAMGTVEMPHINVSHKVKGKATWQDIQIELYDPIVPSAAQAAMEWVRLGHESVTGRDGYSDFYKKDITINVLGPVGDKVEEWTLKGAFATNVSFGDLDWASADQALTVGIGVAYDYAILQY